MQCLKMYLTFGFSRHHKNVIILLVVSYLWKQRGLHICPPSVPPFICLSAKFFFSAIDFQSESQVPNFLISVSGYINVPTDMVVHRVSLICFLNLFSLYIFSKPKSGKEKHSKADKSSRTGDDLSCSPAKHSLSKYTLFI